VAKKETGDTLRTPERRRMTEVRKQLDWILGGSVGRAPSRRLCTRCGVRDRALTLDGRVSNNSMCFECYQVYEALREK
jgi:hypothetical protein